MRNKLGDVLAGIAGLAVVGAATHANVMHAGGYGSSDSALVIAVAVLVVVGMGYAGAKWNSGTRLGGAVLAICLLAGEAYWTGTNTDRELHARIASEAPAAALRAKRAELRRQVADAEKAKKTADDAAITQAALPGCKKNCAQLLTDAKHDAETTLATKQAALDALPKEEPSGTLASYLGLPQWSWDLIMACFRSLAVMGGSVAVGLAMHPRTGGRSPVVPQGTPAPYGAPEILPAPRELDARPVAALLGARVPPAKGKRASWVDIFLEYHRNRSPDDPDYSEKEFGRVMRAICDHAGIPIMVKGNQVYCVGRQVIGQPKRLGQMMKRNAT